MNNATLARRFCACALLIFFGGWQAALAGTITDLDSNQIESLGAGPDGPGGQAYHSWRAYGGGSHDMVHDIAAVQRNGTRTVSAYFKDTGSRWVYLASRKSGLIERTYFDLLRGAVGSKSDQHQATITAVGNGWFRASISYSGVNVTSVHFGMANNNGVPYFGGNPAVHRVFFSQPELSGGEPGTASAAPSAAPAGRMQKGLWVWRAASVLDVSQRNAVLGFMANKGLNTVYIDARVPVLQNHYMLSEFIRAANAREIQVELMFGKPEWALVEHHWEVLNLVDQAAEYVRRFPDAAPTAVHLDIEAHLVAQWQQQRNSVASQLLDLFAKVKSRLNAVSLPLAVDMPVWWDGFAVVRDGVSRPLHQWVIDAADRVVLMDYRDTEARIIADAESELRYASNRGKEIVVGVETMCIPPELITFCEEGSANMEYILGRVDDQLPGHPSYRGYAVHHYEAYSRLRP